jgi:hypothetical protein
MQINKVVKSFQKIVISAIVIVISFPHIKLKEDKTNTTLRYLWYVCRVGNIIRSYR